MAKIIYVCEAAPVDSLITDNTLRITEHRGAVCVKCYRVPMTNNCTQCNKHLKGIPYEYICGDCATKNTNKQT